MVVSGSADRTLKLWGLDFGDCHRSLHGHAESITAVAFVRETHYFFSSSKDHTIRYWDADRFEHILTLRGTRARARALPTLSARILSDAVRLACGATAVYAPT